MAAANALQRKIFTRWVAQKLSQSKVVVKDVVTDFDDGLNLVALIEALSEKKIDGKPLVPLKGQRIQQVAQASRALQFTWDQGVVIKLKPSPENLIDHDERGILGLVWGIMLRFLKFGDEEEDQKISAEDALLMWVQNQVRSYGIEVTNFTKCFHDGKAFACLIHKFRPNLIDPNSLGGNSEENLARVFDAAEKYFGLEKYLTPAEISQLDKQSAFIYVSEYFYGIAEQRKLDLAARRIGKLITFTETNDRLKEEYNTAAKGLHDILARVTVTLNDRTIDNTMAGAKARLAEFYGYRKNDKPPIVEYFFKLEQAYNQVAMRLADNNRPPFVPNPGFTVKDFQVALTQLEATEQERSVALVAELNRQIKLVQLNAQHERQGASLVAWIGTSEAYLNHKEDVQSSGSANYHINVLKAYNDESKEVQSTSVVDLNKLGAELAQEKYEYIAKVQGREGEVASGFQRLAAASKEKGEVLDDDLARNVYKEKYHLIARNHKAKFDTLSAWLGEKKAYLSTKEVVEDVPTADLQIAILGAYEADRKTFEATQVPALKALGQEVLTAAYNSARSSWKFEDPNSITSREAEVDDALSGPLAQLFAAKSQTLADDLAREKEKERLRLLFANQAAAFTSWTKSLVDSVSNSHFGFNLAEVEAFAAKKDGEDSANGATLKARQADYNASFKAGADLGVRENVYTKFSLDDLSNSASALAKAQSERSAAYEKELARQRYNDKLCQDFAAVANPLVKKLDANKAAISDDNSALEAQLESVKARRSEGLGESELKEINAVQAKLNEAGVENNPHTFYTADDLATRVEQYNVFLGKKQAQIEEEIKLKAMRGLTEAQIAEIDQQFKQFDANANGSLDSREFKACLFSLGEERPTSEVKELITKHGDGTKIPYQGFKNFMISLLGDTDSKEEIVNGFKLIGKFEDFVTEDQLFNLMDRHFVDYIKRTAAAAGAGFEYTNWTATMYAR